MAFKKGQSGNPAGRPKKTVDQQEVEALAKTYTTEAIEKLAEWMRSDNPKASVSAACELLDRGHGKARQTVDATVTRIVRDERVQQLRQEIRRQATEQHLIQ